MLGQTWPAVSSAQSVGLAKDWTIFTYAALSVAVFVWALILVAAVRFRRTERNPAPRSQKENNPPLEIAWTVLPLVLVIALFVVTYRIENDVESVSAAPAVRVAVNAFRWGWTFAYAGGPTVSGTLKGPPQMVLPAGRTTEIDLSSSDVVHGFWIPDMLFQRDATPGRVTTFDLTPTKLGTYVGRCAKFCGLDHALMTFTVRVVAPSDYERWLARGGST